MGKINQWPVKRGFNALSAREGRFYRADVVWVSRTAFGLKDPTYLGRVQPRGLDVTVLPHPSGVNQRWNDAHNVRQAQRVMRQAWLESAED